MVGYFKKHVFICTNHKSDGRKSCHEGNPKEICSYLKERLKSLDAYGEGKIRVSSSGCLGRCEVGPNLLVYPEGLWVHYDSKEDIERFLQDSLLADSES